VSRPSLARRLPPIYTVFERLLGLRDRLAGLLVSRRKQSDRRVRLSVEPMEERLVPDSRPLPSPMIFAGSGAGQAAVVNAYAADTGELAFSVPVYGSHFMGGIQVATADFTSDGFPDVVTAPGAGHSSLIHVLDGHTGEQIAGPLGSFRAFSSEVLGGVSVAAADVDGDGKADIIAAADTESGAVVKIFSGVDGHLINQFTVSGAAFSTGMSIAAADFTGDGKAEVVVGAAGSSRVRTYDPLSGTIISGPLGSFKAFGGGVVGVNVGTDSLAGDVNGDGTPDLVIGTRTGEARVEAIDGKTGSVLYDFKPFGDGVTGGAHVGLAYVDDDSKADIVVGTGSGPTAAVSVFSGATGEQLASPMGSYSPFGSFTGGVSIAASNDPSGATLTDFVNGSSSPPTLIAGQVFSLTVTAHGPVFTPTGTITFDLYDSPAHNLLATWTQTLSPTSPPTSATAPHSLTMGSGSYELDTFYSGDSHYAAGAGTLALSPTTSSVPILAPGSTDGTSPISEPAGSGAAARGGVSVSGVSYGSGSITVNRTDLSSGGFGQSLGQTWSWSNLSGYSDGTSGTGATQSQTPHVVQVNGNDTVAVVASSGTAYLFDLFGGAYNERYGGAENLVHDTTDGWFVLTDGTGQTFTFYDFSGGTPTGRGGKFISMTDANGDVTSVTSWSSGLPTEIQQTTGSGFSQLTNSFVYTYVSSGVNAGLLATVTQRTKIGTGSWSTVRSVAYTNYDGTTGPGLANELKTAVVEDASGNPIGTNYYRYYTSGTGTSGQLKYSFGAEAYARLTAALGTGVDSLTDAQVDDYADQYLQYDSSGRVTSVTNAGAGDSTGTGQGTFTYSYTTNSSPSELLDPNVWQTKTVETQPDGTTNTVYTNASGQVMLTVYTDASSNKWITYNRYDSVGRLILTANPSAVSGYNDSYGDLMNYVSGNAQYLSDSSGLITEYTYGSSTTATSSTAGDVLGYVKEIDITHGETGTAVPQEVLSYLSNTAGGATVYQVASSTVYRNDNGTGGETTSAAYTYYSGTNQIESVTTTLPTITTAQNGSNSANTTTTVYDTFGRPVWTKDAGGFSNYTQYDTLTGAVVKQITDVDTSLTSEFSNKPTGWTTPTGGGANLITTYQVDALGRVTMETSPNGNVTYTVYDDADHEVRTYAGWNSTTNMPTGPTTVTREDMANGYTETLTMSAAPTVSSGVPTGTESIADVRSLSRSYVNDAGQVIYTDDYFNLGGLSYSTSTSLGTEGVNFYRTRYQYDVDGNLSRTVDPQGTITRTVYDGLDRAVSEWVGTDDTPTTGVWSPTNLTGTNMVEVQSNQYDNGGVGDGNLTQQISYPGGSATPRETDYWYDWRDRQVAEKDGVETTESTSVNRPLIVTTYDNLGEATETQQYDGDGVTPTISSGVLSLPGGTSSDLRAQTTTSFDNQGQVYQTDTYDVDPSSGSVGSNTLHTDNYYDSRGNVIETIAPGGLVTKNVYDGAGRQTITYLTDGGGGTGYSAASSVSNDIVLEQDETTYDPDGNMILSTDRQRFDSASGTGALGSPSSGIGARVSYLANYYDIADRLTASVDVGTNGGSAYTRPGSVPSRSDTVLVTSDSYAADAVQTVKLTGSPTGGTFTLTFGGQTTSNIAYNASASTVQSDLTALTSIGSGNAVVTSAVDGGWEVRLTGTLGGLYQAQMTANGSGLTGGTSPAVSLATISLGGDAGNVVDETDPKNIDTRTYSDPLGRALQTVEDFTDGAVTNSSNKTTDYTYNSAGMTSLTAELTGGAGQTTAWIYGVSQTSSSDLDSNDIVGTTEYPDPTTGLASSGQEETTTVNALGQTLTATDRNGNVHTLSYDTLGRVTSDAVTTLGSGVDGSVRRIDTAYDGQGNPYLVTSYSATSGGSIVDQVERTFNGLGQMTTDYQAVGGAVNISTSPKVQYAYMEMAGGVNNSRLTSITYPSGYVLTYNYSSGLNDSISRLSSLTDSTGTVESYKYVGLDTVVERDHPESGVNQTFISQTNSTGDAGDQYTGLDRFGRVVEQNWYDPTTSSSVSDEQYGYDRDSNVLYRNDTVNAAISELYGYDNLGQLTSFERGTLNSGHTAITGTPSVNESWAYDPLGNRTSNTVGGSTTTESANAQNEITSVSGSTTPTYDANGNMTTDQNGLKYDYDAWNRLVAVKNSAGTTTLETYSYDGFGRRVTNTVSGTTTDLYYSDQGQVLEEASGGMYTTRYTWSPVYVNAMIMRETDTSGTGLTATGMSFQRLWPLYDANYNVAALLNSSGSVVERYAYDPFGAVNVMDGSYGSRGTSIYGWIYGFQGMRFDTVSSLNEADERWYSPTLVEHQLLFCG
jgi:YD repeat-containing protein